MESVRCFPLSFERGLISANSSINLVIRKISCLEKGPAKGYTIGNWLRSVLHQASLATDLWEH